MGALLSGYMLTILFASLFAWSFVQWQAEKASRDKLSKTVHQCSNIVLTDDTDAPLFFAGNTLYIDDEKRNNLGHCLPYLKSNGVKYGSLKKNPNADNIEEVGGDGGDDASDASVASDASDDANRVRRALSETFESTKPVIRAKVDPLSEELASESTDITFFENSEVTSLKDLSTSSVILLDHQANLGNLGQQNFLIDPHIWVAIGDKVHEVVSVDGFTEMFGDAGQVVWTYDAKSRVTSMMLNQLQSVLYAASIDGKLHAIARGPNIWPGWEVGKHVKVQGWNAPLEPSL